MAPRTYYVQKLDARLSNWIFLITNIDTHAYIMCFHVRVAFFSTRHIAEEKVPSPDFQNDKQH